MAESLLHNLNLSGLKTWQKVAIVGGGLGVAGLAYYESKKKKKSSSSSSTTAGNSSASSPALVTDPTTGQQYPATADDPETGYTYEEEIDLYGSVSAADEALAGGSNSFGLSSLPANNAVVDETPFDATTNTTAEGYSTNAAWSQAVETGLTQIGYDSQDVATALGYYFAGRALTPDQQTIIYDALAEFGPPPSGSYQVIAAPNTVNPPPTGGTGGSTAPASVSGGHVVSANNNDAVIAWTGKNAVKYTTVIQGPGKINGHTGTTTSPQATFSGLEAGHTYDVTITPYNSAGQAGAKGVITIKTTK